MSTPKRSRNHVEEAVQTPVSSSLPDSTVPDVDKDTNEMDCSKQPPNENLDLGTEVQKDLFDIQKRKEEEIRAIEEKYESLSIPYYEKRNGYTSKIPVFWKTALLNHEELRVFLQDEDLEIMKYLIAIDVKDAREGLLSGNKIEFTFTENPFFENISITKSILCDDDGNFSITPDVIAWFDNRNEEKEDDEVTGKRKHQVSSFLEWFELSFEDKIDGYVKEIFLDPFYYYNNGALINFEEEYDEDGELIIGEDENVEQGQEQGNDCDVGDNGDDGENDYDEEYPLDDEEEGYEDYEGTYEDEDAPIEGTNDDDNDDNDALEFPEDDADDDVAIVVSNPSDDVVDDPDVSKIDEEGEFEFDSELVEYDVADDQQE